MTLLPLLLSAVALLLAAAAFFKAVSAGNSSEGSKLLGDAVVGLSDRVAGIQDSLHGIANDLSEARDTLRELPPELRSQSGVLRAQADLMDKHAGFVRTLPSMIAEETESSQLLAEARVSRESLQSVTAALVGIRTGQDSASAGVSAGFSSLTESVAMLCRSLAPRDGNDRVEEILRENSEVGRAQTARLDEIASSLTSLPGLLREATEVGHSQVGRLDAIASNLEPLSERTRAMIEALSAIRSGDAESLQRQDLLVEATGGLVAAVDAVREVLSTLPVRTAEEIASRPAPAPELEELAMAVRDAGSLRGDSVRSIADAVSRVSDRLEASAEEGRAAREDAANRLASSLSTLESVATGVRESLLPLGDALRGHGDAVIPVVKGLETAQDRLEEAAISLRANQVEFAASVGVFTNAAQDLSTGLGAFAREGGEDAARDPAAIQQALLESLERLLTGFSESLRAALAEADLRHREALVEIASRLPDRAG